MHSTGRMIRRVFTLESAEKIFHDISQRHNYFQLLYLSIRQIELNFLTFGCSQIVSQLHLNK